MLISERKNVDSDFSIRLKGIKQMCDEDPSRMTHS